MDRCGNALLGWKRVEYHLKQLYVFFSQSSEKHTTHLGFGLGGGGGSVCVYISKWNSVGKLSLLKDLLKFHNFLCCISPVPQHNCSIAWGESGLSAFQFCHNPD